MTTIGTLKGQRTRAKNSLDKAIAGIQAILNHRANVGGMTHAQLDEIVHMVSPKVAEVKLRLEKLETANEKLSDGYAGEAALLQELQVQLDDESNLMDQVDTAIHEMDDLKYTAERRLEQLARPAARVEDAPGGFCGSSYTSFGKISTRARTSRCSCSWCKWSSCGWTRCECSCSSSPSNDKTAKNGNPKV